MKIISYLCTCKTERKHIMDYMTNAKIKEAICKAFPETENIDKIADVYIRQGYWNDAISTKANIICFRSDMEEHEGMFRDNSFYKEIMGDKPKGYEWQCKSSDGAYTDKSYKVFPSEAEAYKDMRQAALMKMCWNTEYDNDFDDGDTVIGYEVRFNHRYITLDSYSGYYVFTIVPVF